MFSIYLIILLAVLAAWKKTRRFAFYFLPWFLFGIIYDSMRLYPNYMVNDIDVAHLYHAEKSLFGIAASSSAELQAVADHSQLMIPGEYFKVHHCGLPISGQASSISAGFRCLSRLPFICILRNSLNGSDVSPGLSCW